MNSTLNSNETDAMKEKKKKGESSIIFSSFHYLILLIFFIIIFVNTIYLTISTLNMDVSSNNESAIEAKNLMVTAVLISYVADLIILSILGGAYYYQYSNPIESKKYSKELIDMTGAEDIYVAIRIIIFSILMFISVVIASLCFDAAVQILNTEDPSQYNNQYNTCLDIGKLFTFHFVLFSILQGSVYIYQIFYSTGNIKIDPNTIILNKT
jgi:ABC-type uncharacterized transport system permease subunit